jgi:hypothetical protein
MAAELDEHKPTRVICTAGLTGRPNVDWCETNQAAVIRVNVCGTLALADVCEQRGTIPTHLYVCVREEVPFLHILLLFIILTLIFPRADFHVSSKYSQLSSSLRPHTRVA